jgi:hypothetical protein
MKTNPARLILVCIAVLIVGAPSALAQRQLGKKKGPTSKLYLAESTGETQIQNGDKIYAARQATAFDAPGTIIETKADSHDAFVYSNGTGMYVDQNTRVEIDRFVQEPFRPLRDGSTDIPVEPSISQSNVFVSRGAVGICTSKLVSGSSMSYGTPQGLVNIRGGKVSIETNANETVVDLLEGDITVRGGNTDLGGQVLTAGERAVITSGPAGQPPHITIGPIPPDRLQAIDDRVTIACNAKKTVTFEVIEQTANRGLDSASTASDTGEDIVAKPTVPANLPNNIVISPDRLPGN